MPKYFDSHSHLNFSDYDLDREKVIERMKELEIWTMTVGTSLRTSHEAIELADMHEGVFACIGVHPVDDQAMDFNEKKFKELIKSEKVVAIGECGLDYYRLDSSDEKGRERQRSLFKKQIEFALQHDKPLMIHSRSAYEELANTLESYKKTNKNLRGNIHFYSGSLIQAKKFIDLGFALSFAGPITFVRDYDEVLKNIPLESILAETDSPFATPVPHRGKRNEPSYVIEVVKKIAKVREKDLEIVRKTLVENTIKTLGIVT